MNDWWTEQHMLEVARAHLSPEDTTEGLFTCASFGASFYLAAATLGLASLFFVKRYIMVLTPIAVHFVEHKAQLRATEVVGVLHFPYDQLSVRFRRGLLNNFITFHAAGGGTTEMQFPKRRYAPSSALTSWDSVCEILRTRCTVLQ
ncbi:MAG: hypothetical protein Q7S20_08045 [Gemmatimonadaceae bacterium]|nr:hypothetical protein [Gemmatimonadaceae bacterium]